MRSNVPDVTHLTRAITIAAENAVSGGGPFGAVIVDAGGHVIAEGVNRVTATHDPTAHAEVVAIRSATKILAVHELDGCVLYASCEPCPMCLGAALWARLRHVYFAATRDQAAAAGFDDANFYRLFQLGQGLPLTHVCHALSDAPFDAWRVNSSKVPY